MTQTRKERLMYLARKMSAPRELVEYITDADGQAEEYMAACALRAHGAGMVYLQAVALETLGHPTEAAALRAQAAAERAPWEWIMRQVDARLAELAEAKEASG